MLAEALLEDKGYRVLGRRHVVERDGVRLAEVDMLAEKDGTRYAVEVKAGRISTTDVRQAYSNAKLLGAEPLIVAKGFSDRAAEEYARQLGVNVILMPDYILVEPEELGKAVARAVEEAIETLLPPNPAALGDEDLPVLEALASSRGFAEAAEKLGVKTGELESLVAKLREKGVIGGGGGYWRLRLQARLLLLATLSSRGLSRDRPS